MKTLYHRIALASVGVALGFALGVNQEARSATFSLTSTYSFFTLDIDEDGRIDLGNSSPNGERYVGIKYKDEKPSPYDYTVSRGEYESFYQFNIANLSLNSNTVISSAIFQTRVSNVEYAGLDSKLQAYGYTEDSMYLVAQFHNNGEYLDEKSLLYILESEQKIATFNVLPFISQIIKNDDLFWLGIHRYRESGYGNEDAFITLPWDSRLTITTADVAEPVPEPTTIFGSALALGVGGWLKRKKSSRQNKTTSQH